MKYIKTFENIKQRYPVEFLRPFIDYLIKKLETNMKNEGWTICYTDDVEIPDEINLSYNNRKGDYWMVQKDFETDILNSDYDADVFAKKYGIMIDNYGVVLGYNNISFLEHPEEINNYKEMIDFYININKYNL